MDWCRDCSRPFIIGHRGASAEAPENTLAAFALAQAQSADGIEFDVQLSADGWPVVIHDFTLDRTTSGQGRVSDYSLVDLKKMDAGSGETIPTLAEVFEQCGSDFLYNIELKSASYHNRDLVTAVADTIKTHQLNRQILISSFNPFIIKQAKQKFPKNMMIAHLWQQKGGRFKQTLIPVTADHPLAERVDESYMAWARQRPLRVHVWTVDEVTEAHRLANLGVQAIITNQPQKIREGLYEDQGHS